VDFGADGRLTMAKEKTLSVPLNFLLGCSEQSLDAFELARLARVANLRKQLIETIDELIDESAVIRLVSFFRMNDRETLKRALENEEDALTWARRMIRGGGEIVPRIRGYSESYQKRNIAAGKCAICPKPLAKNSVRLCEKHLAMDRKRGRNRYRR
jgi:hypothetical protein